MHEEPIRDGGRDAADIRVMSGAWIGPARIVSLRRVMVAVATFAILVLLPAAIAAQAIEPI
jgi:hypothetical protein